MIRCHTSERFRPSPARGWVALTALFGSLLLAGPSRSADPELRLRPTPAAKSPAPARKPAARKRPSPRPRTAVQATGTTEAESPPPASTAHTTPAPSPEPRESPMGQVDSLLQRRLEQAASASRRPPQVSDLLGHWHWSVGGGGRTGTLHLSSIRADGKAVGTFSSIGMAGRCEATITNGRVDFIMRWSVLFVHGRVHGTAPVEHLRRKPVHLVGEWQGDNPDGFTPDFEATKLSP